MPYLLKVNKMSSVQYFNFVHFPILKRGKIDKDIDISVILIQLGQHLWTVKITQKIVIRFRFSGCSLDSLHELEAVNDKLYVERINFGWKNFEVWQWMSVTDLSNKSRHVCIIALKWFLLQLNESCTKKKKNDK